jgi:hypothetical protein
MLALNTFSRSKALAFVYNARTHFYEILNRVIAAIAKLRGGNIGNILTAQRETAPAGVDPSVDMHCRRAYLGAA